MKRLCNSAATADNSLIKKPSIQDLSKATCEESLKLSKEEDPISDVEEEVETESSSNTINTRLGKCEVCAAREAVYTCPKCEVKTCCLVCVRIHKKELECDGIRDRTKFIPLKQMTKMDFMSDYYFLEECTRYVEDRKVDQIKKYTRYNRDLPLHLNRLRNAAKERDIILKFLLQNFARHKENTTYYDWRTKKIHWRLKWVFVNAGNLCYTDEKCLEDEYLRDLLKKYVDRDEVVENVPEKRKLEYYQSKGVQKLKVLLKAEGIKRCKDRFYLLDVNKTLKANLSGKTLVEYPWIYVSYEEDCNGFDVIDSDEDVEAETKKHETNMEEYRKEMLIKQKRAVDGDEEDVDEEEKNQEKMEKLASEKRKQERQLKRQEYEKVASNFLFSDEQLMEVLSSSSEEEV
ncbi:box C/D snoRNA protein 1 [Lucilia cuprina]|uniref:box C/D snoRNA protein 1 n=1 Tax=Lucilia cuprina TaxID=7375 RepID=UPI001F064446|nr:box C/D snoRNA protein 1 [Lucilia cuprina]XP_046803117.1 box C/D snoRNA protein 1 [Lucilia cuprina]